MTFLPDDAVGRLREVAVWPELPSRYTILRPLGRGGMGAVYAARDTQLGRDVAIKVSAASAAGGPLEDRLRREAQVLARLEHPGIVPVHDAGLLPDAQAFYVMKLVRGVTLADHAATLEGEASVLAVFERVAETLAFAHAAGVVHRDLKPSNVMVGSFGEVLVLDWGVAKIVGTGNEADEHHAPGDGRSDVQPATSGGARIGTPGFMSPEQERGESSSAGPESDVYSLGVLLFWMLTGASPPALADEAASRLEHARIATSRRLRAIVMKCLAEDRRARYADARALADDLARYRAGSAVSAHRETALERAGRWFATYRTFILLVLAYLVMRAVFAFSR